MHLRLIFFVLLLLSYSKVRAQEVSDFALTNVNGETVSLQDFKKAKGFVVVFTCNHCPFAQFYPERLNKLNEKYKRKGVPLLAINPMDTLVYAEENIKEMLKISQKHNFNFPYLLDGSQKVAKNFKAKRTPQAYIIWKEQKRWLVKYQGAIDDNGAEPEKVENHYLENALIELLSGKNVTQKETASVGCKINYRK
jgi:peroxiredoxin